MQGTSVPPCGSLLESEAIRVGVLARRSASKRMHMHPDIGLEKGLAHDVVCWARQCLARVREFRVADVAKFRASNKWTRPNRLGAGVCYGKQVSNNVALEPPILVTAAFSLSSNAFH